MEKKISSIALVSNIVFEPYIRPVVSNTFGEGVDIYTIQYGEHSEKKYETRLRSADLIVLWLNFENLFPNAIYEILCNEKNEQEIVDYVTNLSSLFYSELSIKADKNVIWILFEDYFCKLSYVFGKIPICNNLIDRINFNIVKTFSNKENVCFLEIEQSIAKIGISKSFDNKGKYRWNAPYSKVLIQDVINEVCKQHKINSGYTKKCLVLDCDNVLWGGILSEDGIENIRLGGGAFGKEFVEFQLYLLSLFYQGVILAICSKNDINDVKNVFCNHSEMILKEDNIAWFQVNWNNKPDNIKAISVALNIDLNSMVFIDDSVMEIESVKAMLPEVKTVLYDRNTVYEHLSCFNLKLNNRENDIQIRNETYRTNRFRDELKSECNTYEDFINALQMEISMYNATQMEISRISELTQRANKCTNGRRYTVEELKEKLKAESYELYCVSVRDKFSDLGVVGAIGIDNDILDLFVLSCRALGRGVEDKMLDYVEKKFVKKSYYISTNKNEEFIMKLLRISEKFN